MATCPIEAPRSQSTSTAGKVRRKTDFARRSSPHIRNEVFHLRLNLVSGFYDSKTSRAEVFQISFYAIAKQNVSVFLVHSGATTAQSRDGRNMAYDVTA
jgi:hypothetical protein